MRTLRILAVAALLAPASVQAQQVEPPPPVFNWASLFSFNHGPTVQEYQSLFALFFQFQEAINEFNQTQQDFTASFTAPEWADDDEEIFSIVAFIPTPSQQPPVSVPEPGTGLLALSGLLGLAVARKKRGLEL